MIRDKLRFFLQITLLAALAAPCIPTGAFAATYYISPTGSDLSGNGSASAPWKTLSYACGKVTSAGNTIYINPGSYTDSNRCNLAIGVNIQGAGKDQVTITSSYGGSIATGYIYRQTVPQNPLIHGNNEISGFTLDGSNKTLVTGIFIRGTDYLNIHDIKFRNIKSNALWIEGWYDWSNSNTTPPPAYGQSVVIHDIETNDTTTESDLGGGPRLGAIMLGALQGAQVYNLTINENYASRGTGIKAVAGWLKAFKGYNWKINTNVLNTDAFVFEMYNFLGDSEIYGCTFNHALSLNSGPQTPISGSTWNLKIHDTVTDFSGFTSAGALGHELSHNYLDFYNNYIYGNKGRGAGLWTTNYLTASSVTGWRFRNNVVYNCAAGGLTIERGTLSGVEIYNNIFDVISSSPWGGYGIDTEMFSGTISGAKIQNNIFRNCSSGPMYIHSSFANTLIDHNWYYGNGNSDAVKNYSSTTTQTNNTKGVAPSFAASGARPDPYYRPSSATANIVDAGVDVGLPYTGSAPPVGVYEYSDTQITLSAPTSLRVVN